MNSPPVVAIFNSSDDVVEMLRIALEQAGCVVVNGHLGLIRRGERRIGDLVEEHNPAVILHDLIPPYDRSWRFLEHLRSSPMMEGRRFVVTSTNAQRATEVIGDAAYVYEIVGKPHDLGRIADAVLAAIAGRDNSLPPETKRA